MYNEVIIDDEPTAPGRWKQFRDNALMLTFSVVGFAGLLVFMSCDRLGKAFGSSSLQKSDLKDYNQPQ